MEEKIDSWCIKVTTENKKEIKDFFGVGYNYTIGAYYGINKERNTKHGVNVKDFSSYFNYEITTEEFYKKIGLIKQNQELIIEIW